MALSGSIVLVGALLCAAVAVVLLWASGSRSPKRKLIRLGNYAAVGTTILLTICCAIILFALLTNDTSLDYVIRNRAGSEVFFQIAALWGGRQGSLLFWTWLIGLFSLWALFRCRKDASRLDVVATAIIQLILAVFIGILVFSQTNNPFVPTDPRFLDAGGNLTGAARGLGMNMLLKHWAMALHPPALFIGYAGFTVPASYALAALVTGDVSVRWVQRSNGMTVCSWLMLSIGIGLGAVWAYVVLGWGGYWGWDPVENASLLPWLVGVALIHTFTVCKNRDAMKRMAILCAVVAFVLVILGTFITRSGIVSSVHAFEGDAVSLVLFAMLMGLTLVAGIIGIIMRWKNLAGNDELTSFASRDAAYYFNTVLMLLAALVVAYLTLSSAFPEWMPFGGWKVAPLTYNNLVRPAAIIYCAIVAICPLLAWQKTQGKGFWKRFWVPLTLAVVVLVAMLVLFFTALLPNYERTMEVGGDHADDLAAAGPAAYYHGLAFVGFAVASLIIGVSLLQLIRMLRFYRKSTSPLRTRLTRLGGYLAHLGVGLCLIGLIGSSMYVISTDVAIPDQPGTRFTFENYTFEYARGEVESLDDGNQRMTTHMQVFGQSGWYLGTVSPGIEVSSRTQMQKMIAATLFSPLRDVFVVFNGIDSNDDLVFSLKINPLISVLWTGFGVLVLGATLAALATRRKVETSPVKPPLSVFSVPDSEGAADVEVTTDEAFADDDFDG